MKALLIMTGILLAGAPAAPQAETPTSPPVPATGALSTEAEVGSAIFFRSCGLCHDDSEHMLRDSGPPLFGVVNRRVASIEGFEYSPALRRGGWMRHKWSEKRLDKFLSGPQHMYTGTDMPIMFNDPKVRHALIAYLKTLTPRP